MKSILPFFSILLILAGWYWGPAHIIAGKGQREKIEQMVQSPEFRSDLQIVVDNHRSVENVKIGDKLKSSETVNWQIGKVVHRDKDTTAFSKIQAQYPEAGKSLQNLLSLSRTNLEVSTKEALKQSYLNELKSKNSQFVQIAEMFIVHSDPGSVDLRTEVYEACAQLELRSQTIVESGLNDLGVLNTRLDGERIKATDQEMLSIAKSMNILLPADAMGIRFIINQTLDRSPASE